MISNEYYYYTDDDDDDPPPPLECLSSPSYLLFPLLFGEVE